jgi:minichromosome maintenance protein 10
MATMGIVFSNSGTRISKTGRAFSIVTLGDLHTGPTVSVFLFGNVYSKFSTKIQVGSVVAVLGSSIMPARNGGETRICLSINDTQQIVLVGKSMDYGTCSGVDIRKNNSSFGQSEGTKTVKCKNYVDLRLGCFCKYHQKQQLRNQAVGVNKHLSLTSANKKKKGMTVMQTLKSDAVMHQKAMTSMANLSSNQSKASNVMNIVMPGMGPVVTVHDNYLNNHSIHGARPFGNLSSRGGLVKSKDLEKALALSNIGPEMNRKLSSSLNSSLRAPKHLLLSNKSSSQKVNELRNGNIGLKESTTGINNPYVKSCTYKSTLVTNPKLSTKPSQPSNNNDVLGHALASVSQDKKGRNGKNHAFENRKRNLVHMEGMDGQVPIPKPSALFRQQAPLLQQNIGHRTTLPQQPVAVSPSPEQREMLMERQKELAQVLKRQGTVNCSKSCPIKSKSRSSISMSKASPVESRSVTSSSDLDMILGVAPLSTEQRKLVLDAKSKFSDEAKAESFAKSRQAITELEKKETCHEKRQSRKNNQRTDMNPSGSAIIILEYKCLTCKKVTKQRPSHCITMRHQVKFVRDIKKHERASEKRLNLKSRSPEDGGMVLGSGLEWTGWKARSD